MTNGFCREETDIDRLLEEDGDFGVAVHHEEDTFPMNLMSNETITWTVERERGMSFDLTALCDAEGRPEYLLPEIKREIKLEADSTLNDFPFGHPFGQGRPTASVDPPSPLFRPTAPAKRLLPSSFETRDSAAKRQHQHQKQCDSAGHDGEEPETNTVIPSTITLPGPAAPRAHTRSQAARLAPNAPSSRSSSSSPPRGGFAGAGSSSTTKSRTGNCKVKGEGGSSRRRRSTNVDAAALAAELGLVEGRQHGCGGGGRRGGLGAKVGVVHRVGAYTLEERASLVAKFHAKRGRRIWRKKIKYDCRKKLADKRPRLKGRFVTQEELDGLDAETLAKVTGLGPYSDSSDVEAEEDSDSSEGYTGPVPTTSRYKKNGSRCGNGVGGEVGACGASTADTASTSGGRETSQRACSVRSPPARGGLRVRGPNGSSGPTARKNTSSGCGKPEQKSLKSSSNNSRKNKPAVEEEETEVRTAAAPPLLLVKRDRVDSIGGLSVNDPGGFDVMDVFAAVMTGGEGDEEDEVANSGTGEVEAGELLEASVNDEYCDTSGGDLVAGFMVDDILSNNFSVIPNHDILSAGVTVN